MSSVDSAPAKPIIQPNSRVKLLIYQWCFPCRATSSFVIIGIPCACTAQHWHDAENYLNDPVFTPAGRHAPATDRLGRPLR
ncbi:MAG: hypothetical protein Q7R45_16130, partial [Sulfuricaulis sp.]|nr:hypothetical protein [Sulfuricaulis sp.]